MFKHILVALDGSSASEKAIEKGLQLAQVTGARVLALTATEIWSAMAVSGPDGRKRIEKFELAQERAAKAILAAFEARAKVMGVAPVLLRSGPGCCSRDHECRGEGRVRSDRDGIARTARVGSVAARKPGTTRAHGRTLPRTDLPIGPRQLVAAA